MYVTLDNGSKIECDDEYFAKGGEGEIYWDKAGTHVIKLYTTVEPTREETLRKIIGEYNVTLNAPAWKELFAWPEAIIKQPRLGITMPRRKGTDLLWFLFPKPRQVYAAKHGLAKLGKWQNYLQIAIKMTQIVARLHKKGLCHSDLSFKNFLVDPEHDAVVLLDCDSLVVPNVIPPKVLGTPMCMAPELAAQLTGGASITPTTQTDLHAMATLIYWLLLQRHPLLGPKVHDPDPNISEALALGSKALFIEHPTDLSNHRRDIPSTRSFHAMLTPAVTELVEKAFVMGLHHPDSRPQAATWELELRRMLDSLLPCDNPGCPMGSFVLNPDRANQPKCLCSRPLKSPPTLPIFKFHHPVQGRVGQFMDDKHTLVGWPNRVFPHSYVPETEEKPKVRLIYEASTHKWFIENLDSAEMCLLDNINGHQDIHPKQKLEISHNSRLLFGPPNQYRMAHIEMVKVQ